MEGSRTAAARVPESVDRKSLNELPSLSFNPDSIGPLDATYGEPFHLSPGPDRVDDAAAPS